MLPLERPGRVANNQLQSQFAQPVVNILHCNLDYNHPPNYIQHYYQLEECTPRTSPQLVEHSRQLAHSLFILLGKVGSHQLPPLPKCYQFVLFHPRLTQQVG
jgi:hypothetical protein